LWGAGYRISEPDQTDALLATFDGRIGLARLAMIHLNDSKAGLGSRLDRHEHLGAGAIGEPGLRHLLTHPLLAHVAYFLETPGMDEGYDKINLRRARDIAAGRPLRRLPARAMNVRGSRARTAPTAEPAPDEDLDPEARLEAV
jgi:endonuclease IV